MLWSFTPCTHQLNRLSIFQTSPEKDVPPTDVVHQFIHIVDVFEVARVAILQSAGRCPGHNVVIIDDPKYMRFEVKIKIPGNDPIPGPWLSKRVQPRDWPLVLAPACNRQRGTEAVPRISQGPPAVLGQRRHLSVDEFPYIAERLQKPLVDFAAKWAMNQAKVKVGDPVRHATRLGTTKRYDHCILVGHDEALCFVDVVELKLAETPLV